MVKVQSFFTPEGEQLSSKVLRTNSAEISLAMDPIYHSFVEQGRRVTGLEDLEDKDPAAISEGTGTAYAPIFSYSV